MKHTIKRLGFMLLFIFSINTMEKDNASFFSHLPQELLNQLELVKFSFAEYKTIDEAVQKIKALCELPRFKYIIDDQETINFIIESIGSKLKLFGNDSLAIAKKIGTPSALLWIKKREKEIPLEEAFIKAASKGNIDQVKDLLSKNVNINAQNNVGQTALIAAILSEKSAVVKLLLNSKDLDINKQNGNNKTALSYIVGADFPDLEMLKTFLNNPRVNVNLSDITKWTPLMIACAAGHSGAVELLLSNPGIDLNVQNKYGYTALMLASVHNQAQIVNFLLKAGADSSIKNDTGDAALDIARAYNYKRIEGLLENATAVKK